MNTALECMPCFMKMALRDARLACPDDEAMHQEIVMAWGRMLGDLDLSVPPPDIARHLTDLIRSKTGCEDLYREDKLEANARVLELLPGLKVLLETERIKPDGDPLALALELAIIGNYIDRGVDLGVDWEAELENVSDSVPTSTLDEFKSLAKPGSHILILGDNTGEIVLDMLLVEELQRQQCVVTYAVRSKPVINDATMEDAIAVGMTALCEVVESGVDTPGTVLSRCTPEFLERMEVADIILSKGQGNFESLEGVWPGVFCAFKVKCKRVAEDAGLPFGSSAFLRTFGPDSNDNNSMKRGEG
ncbi:MAG: ARMT1-like domain-containing protein [Pseudodesulfovibrio sp.]